MLDDFWPSELGSSLYNAGLMLVQRRRRCPNIEAALVQRVAFAVLGDLP